MVLLALGGLGRGRVGYAWVLTLFGDYRGSVRRTGLVWVSPLLLRRRVDVRLRHWRSEPLPAVDANGTALRVVVLVVWRIKDTVRAVLGIEDHEAYLSAQVEAAMARVLSQLPADAFHEDAPSLRDAEAVGDALTRMLKADCEPVGVEVYSAQPTGIEYAPEVAAAMQRRRIAAIDSKHRDSVLTSVVDAVDDTVNRLTTRGIVELDDYERKALVKDLTVAFYTGRSGGGEGLRARGSAGWGRWRRGNGPEAVRPPAGIPPPLVWTCSRRVNNLRLGLDRSTSHAQHHVPSAQQSSNAHGTSPTF